jgi:branched-chain amino acid transport system substrate-binding protein
MSSPALTEVGGDAVEGTVVASFFQPKEPRPAVERFVTAFEKKYGVEPDAGAALAYDAVAVLAQALRAAASPAPEDVALALRNLADWQGVTGSFRFDEKGDLIGRRATKSIVRNGKFAYLDETSTP